MPYITLGMTDGVDTLSVPRLDDAVSNAIKVPMGIPFGNFTHRATYVSPSLFEAIFEIYNRSYEHVGLLVYFCYIYDISCHRCAPMDTLYLTMC